MNTNIASIQSIASASQNANYITSVTPVTQNGKEIGYTIAFKSGNPITIYHGTDGNDGADGNTPKIGVKKDTDGIYYWTVDDGWLLDANGKKVKAVGTDGKDGNDGVGTPGKDGITPQLKIEGDYWYVSVDKGATWSKLSKAKGEDGKDGTDGDTLFASIDYTTSEDYVVFTLSNGVDIKVPTSTAFDRLNTYCRELNSNIEGLGRLIEDGAVISEVTPTDEGYIIKLSDDTSFTITNGKDGDPGSAPKIGVKKDSDDIWYWTLDDAWLLDENGQKVRAVGKDGTDGNTPQMKIEDDYWYVSLDGGETWTKLSKAKGEDGQDGTGGDSMFSHVDYTTSQDYVIFTLSNGVNIKVPTWTAFDRLNTRCNEMNSNLEGIGTILDAIDQSLFIKSFSTMIENGKEIGYIITFSNDEKINIYHGKDGENGSGGGSGHTPQMGVRQYTDGVWYWTVDGEWLLDTNGDKVKAVGTDGTNGTDGVTPKLKIENGYWYVSMDKGVTWTQYGKATGENGADGDSFFKSVTQDENNVYFTLSDNTKLTIPKSSILEISFDPVGEIPLKVGVKKDITYTVTSSLTPVKVEVVTSSNIQAMVTPTDATGLTGTISFEATFDINEYSKIVVMVYNGPKMIMSTLTPVVSSENGHEYVDLGLPSGLKWATCNVGANTPEESGDYFAWGETSSKSNYDWSTYKWCNGSKTTLSKYINNASYGTVVDNKLTLEEVDDVARANWGGNWRMPTDAEWTELVTECTWTWTVQNGVDGYLVTGSNGSSIFLPSTGYQTGTNYGSISEYWSSSITSSLPYFAEIVSLERTYIYRYGGERRCGRSVRPVTDKGVRVSVNSISLNQNSIVVSEGSTMSLTADVNPWNATQPAVIWSSSNTSVATVDYTGKVTAVSTGSATITATTYDGGKKATCTVTVKSEESEPGTENGHEYVDLGLPSGLKWATCNVGASSPEEYGDYFAWGETKPYYISQDPLVWKTDKYYEIYGYGFDLYRWGSGDGDDCSALTKYNTNSSYGIVDNKTVLDLEDDAAKVTWGSSWRMPCDAEWTELRTECTWSWTTKNGVDGDLITGPNGNSIFLPAAGFRTRTYLWCNGGDGYYWSSSLYSGSQAWDTGFSPYDVSALHGYRCRGQSIRPVSDEGVRVSVSGISLDRDALHLAVGTTVTLTATVVPSNATQPAVIWSSSDTSVATVDYAGKVITVGNEGYATITATTYDGGYTANCSVYVSY